ncbi:MAG: heparinase, partial [Planctomycetaceae bacterium]
LDLGTFEIDALGQRWARDLGSDDYNLPGYFEKQSETGRRWNYYRMISSSHSVIMLDGKQQAWAGTAKVVDHLEGGERPYVVIDLTSAYPAATAAMRGLAMVGGRKAVLVQDEMMLPKPTDVAWAMTTDAAIAADGATAVLKIGDKTLTARILSPAGAAFTVESAEQKPPEKTNKGVSRLMVNLKQQSGNVRVAVLLSPVWPEGKEVKTAEVKPLKEWKK